MILSHLSFQAFLPFFMCFAAANAGLPGNFNSSVQYDTIFVDSSGHGNFLTIQSAIDSIPPNNQKWTRIYIKAGLYREQIHIPHEKPYIYMQGEGKWRTIVSYDRHDAINTSATFISEADNVVATKIGIINSYNYPPMNNKNPVTQAVAAMIYGDKCAFYKCAFAGLQDTLWDASGRHYFKKCVIWGGIDFICGSGQSIYEECNISVAAQTLNGPGFITAQRRSSSTESSGFVFKNCNISGNGTTFLGRAWGFYSRVIFYNCSLSNIIVPEGWQSWYAAGHENQVTFAEYNCSGLGSKTSARVKWEYNLTDDMVKQFTDISYIDNEGWTSNLPSNMLQIYKQHTRLVAS